jgi:MOSC domain-containing protein YiiM/uncharacterized damage-inducible protein DinB
MDSSTAVIETCAGCGFDASDYTRMDLLGTLRALAPMWRTMVGDTDPNLVVAAPGRGVWSALQHAVHVRDVIGVSSVLAHRALSQDHPVVLPSAATPKPATGEPATPDTMSTVIEALEQNAARLSARANKLTDRDWTRPLRLGETTVDVAGIVAHAVHDGTHHFRDAGRALHSLGAGAPTQHGTLVQISASDGGVPKTALLIATIDRHGVVGDRQAERKHHGKPLQALSLWSADVISALRAEGHSVAPGAAGENLTVAGIDWRTIRPGVRVAVGDVMTEISAFATPCVKNAQWFVDRDFHRIDHDLHPGWSRAYAWVLDGGEVAAGAEVVVEP